MYMIRPMTVLAIFAFATMGYAAEPQIDVELGSDELTSGVPGTGDLTVEQINAWLAKEGVHEPFNPKLPLGLAAAEANIYIPADNPMTKAKIELGRQLYFDTRLSSDSTISCGSCHHPSDGFGRKTRFGIGVNDQEGGRNSPVSFNRIVSKEQFWDGRAESLEAQAVGPIANPIEMGNTHENAVASVKKLEGYQVQFDKIFPGEGVAIDNIGKAIATFERAIVSLPAPYDYLQFRQQIEENYDEEDIADMKDDDPEVFARYQEAKAKTASLSELAILGRDLFFSEKANCTACHAGANFTDEKYHNLGVGMEVENPDIGRAEISKDAKDTGAFKTPTVRNVAKNPPYMHDGSQQTLEEVVEWYAKGGHPNPHLSDKVKKLDLTDNEKAALVVFMSEALSSDFPAVEIGRLPK